MHYFIMMADVQQIYLKVRARISHLCNYFWLIMQGDKTARRNKRTTVSVHEKAGKAANVIVCSY